MKRYHFDPAARHRLARELSENLATLLLLALAALVIGALVAVLHRGFCPNRLDPESLRFSRCWIAWSDPAPAWRCERALAPGERFGP